MNKYDQLRNNLLANNFIQVNKILFHLIGIKEAVYLSTLVNWHKYLCITDKIDSEDYFYMERNLIERETGIKSDSQRLINKRLTSQKIIFTKRQKAPDGGVLNYYKINADLINQMFSECPLDKGFKSLKTRDCIYNNIRENNTFLKRKKEESKKRTLHNKPKSVREKNKYILYWNKLARQYPDMKLTIPKSLDPETGVHHTIVKYFRQLERGMFGEDKIKLGDKFMKNNSIKVHELDRKFSEDEIKEVLRNFVRLMIPGTLPYQNKEKIPRSLDRLIYNPIKNTSFFWSIFKCPPYLASKGKTDEQLDNEIKYRTKKELTVKEYQAGLDEIDEMWEKANPKIRKRRKPKHEDQ